MKIVRDNLFIYRLILNLLKKHFLKLCGGKKSTQKLAGIEEKLFNKRIQQKIEVIEGWFRFQSIIITLFYK